MTKTLRMVSWNVNGIRAVFKKDFFSSWEKLNPDIFVLQETKIQADQRTDEMINVEGYHSYWSYASTKKGYSGVAAYTRLKPEYVKHGIGIEKFDAEGRILELGFKDFVFFNVYFPNGQKDETRLQYKLDFYQTFFEYTDALISSGKKVIITGDYNTAHNEIDLKNPKSNEKRSGFLRIERDWLDDIVQRGYIDTFRYFNPDTIKYSWWSYRFNARKNNTGWRIDYFFVSKDIIKENQVKDVFIDNDITGSDHCPIGLVIEV